VRLLQRARRHADAVCEADGLATSLARTAGERHPDTLAARTLLAEELMACKHHEPALAILAELAVTRSRLDGPASAPALDAVLDWGSALTTAGRNAEAITLLRQARATAELTRPPSDPIHDRVRTEIARAELGPRLGGGYGAVRRRLRRRR